MRDIWRSQFRVSIVVAALATGLLLVACGQAVGELPAPNDPAQPTGSQPEPTTIPDYDKPGLTVTTLGSGLTSTTSPIAPSTTRPGITSTTGSSVSSTTQPGSASAVPEHFLAAVIDDAASRRDADRASVRIMSGQAVDWPDGSLGCPEPGKSYTQVIVPGYLVMVDVSGATLEYHLNQRGDFRQCTGGNPLPPSET
jgi:hypothetical protein